MYTFDVIILEKNIIREKNIRIVVLSKDFGKITLWYKKQLTGVDIGDIARVVVKRENSLNIAKSIETRHYLMSKKWNFETLFAFLSLLKTIKICTADEDVVPQIFSDYEKSLKNFSEDFSLDAILLFEMRLFKHLGSLNPDFFKGDQVLHYIYEKISLTPLEKILKSQKLQEKHKKIIEKSNLFSLSTFL